LFQLVFDYILLHLNQNQSFKFFFYSFTRLHKFQAILLISRLQLKVPFFLWGFLLAVKVYTLTARILLDFNSLHSHQPRDILLAIGGLFWITNTQIPIFLEHWINAGPATLTVVVSAE
jgi:hypothetical protein